MSQISVLMSLYKNTTLSELVECFDSIASQTLLPNELIIVLDGPIKSNVRNYLAHDLPKKLKDISKIIDLKINQGLGKALNLGLEKSSNEIIIRVDTDDINHPERFDKQLRFLKENPDISVSSSAVTEFETDINKPTSIKRLPLSYKDVMKYSQYRNPVNHPSAIFLKKDIEAVGGYMHMPFFEDYYLWVRLLANGYKIKNMDDSLVYMRIDERFFSRRVNLRTTISHFKLYLYMAKNRLYNPIYLFLIFFLKEMIKLLPVSVLKLVFKNFLRK